MSFSSRLNVVAVAPRTVFDICRLLLCLTALIILGPGTLTAQAQSAPAAPTNLQATAGWRQITLSWTASVSSGVTGYSVLRGTQSGGPYTEVAPNVSGTSYVDGGLTTGSTYYYVLVAHAPAGDSSYSDQLSASPRFESTPPSVTIATPTNGATLAALTSITGTSADSGGSAASGVEHVDVFLFRTWRGATEYWDGTLTTPAWQSAAVPLPVGGSALASWTRNTTLPAGADLPPGQYQVKAQSFDLAGNASTIVTRSFKMAGDTTAPTIAITSPANNSYIDDLTAVNGTIQDEVGGSGVNYVQVRLGRTWNGTTEYWNGTAWGSASSYLPATLGSVTNGVYNWQAAGMWPVGDVSMPDGAYNIAANGYDCSGNVRAATSTVIKVGDDNTPPVVSITTPASDAVIASTGLTQISGTASDPVVAGQTRTGMNMVRVYLTRMVSGVKNYWNPAGGVWTTNNTYWQINYDTTRADGPFSVTTQLPSGANLSPGSYSIAAYAFDITNNLTIVSQVLTVVAPPAAPQNLTATAGDEEVALSWTASATAASYQLYRALAHDGPYDTEHLLVAVTGATYTDTQVTAGTTYYYVVRAVNVAGESANSNEASATPVVAPQPDLQIYVDGQETALGDNVYNSTGANQSQSVITTLDTPAAYYVPLQNDGDHARTFVVQSSAAASGWSVHYFLLTAPVGDDPEYVREEITTAITGEGWITPELAPGASCLLLVEVTPDGTVADGATCDVTFHAAPTLPSPTVDVVKLTTTRKKHVLGIKYKRASDTEESEWRDLPSTPLEVEEGEVVGFKVILATGAQPITVTGEFKPEWTQGDMKHIGDVVWLDFDLPAAGHENDTQRITVEWGDSSFVDVHVVPEAE